MQMADATLRDIGASVVNPREPTRRGGHVALQHPEAMRVCRALRAQGVVPDFRPPNIIRLAPAPLYNSFADCCRALQILSDILTSRTYEQFATTRELVS